MADEPERSVNTNYYSDAVIERAFNLQEHIRENGLDGIYFNENAKRRMADVAQRKTDRQIASRLKSRFGKR